LVQQQLGEVGAVLAGDAGDQGGAVAGKPRPGRPASPPPAVGTSGSPVPGSVPDSAAALAAATFREKAEKGDATAQHDLGVLYADGRGVPRDYGLAARWFRRSATSGMANAQFNLAVLTERGLGVPADAAEAVRLYRAAAEQGHAGAQYNLGIAMAEGRGAAQDYAEAAGWFRRAADQGFAKAAYNLGVLHERGLAGTVDDVEAYRWYARALESGDGDAKERMEQIARRLPPQDLNQARQRPTGSADPALVADVQRLLTARGYKPGAADGSFGERTADAIRRFQRDIGVAQDGQATIELLRRLEGAPASQ
jgi:TPR repeat protein